MSAEKITDALVSAPIGVTGALKTGDVNAKRCLVWPRRLTRSQFQGTNFAVTKRLSSLAPGARELMAISTRQRVDRSGLDRCCLPAMSTLP